MKSLRIGLAALALSSIVGCSIGMAPKGPDSSEVQKEFSTLPPEKQISGIQHSPLPPDEKERRIKEIEDKYGIKREGASASGPGQ